VECRCSQALRSPTPQFGGGDGMLRLLQPRACCRVVLTTSPRLQDLALQRPRHRGVKAQQAFHLRAAELNELSVALQCSTKRASVCSWFVSLIQPDLITGLLRKKASASKLEYPGRVRLLLEHVGAC